MSRRKLPSACGICLTIAVSLMGQPIARSARLVRPDQTSKQAIQRVEFCDLMRAPERYLGKRIEVKALLQKSIMKPTTLISPACRERSVIVLIECDPMEKCSEVRRQIEKNLRESKDGVGQEVELTIGGVPTKNPISSI